MGSPGSRMVTSAMVTAAGLLVYFSRQDKSSVMTV